jgi:hypothetical protein
VFCVGVMSVVGEFIFYSLYLVRAVAFGDWSLSHLTFSAPASLLRASTACSLFHGDT